MSEHLATVVWDRNGADFGTGYDRSHVWRFDGGVEVAASSATHLHGDPSRVDPEEAFVAAISSCHMLWFLHLAADEGFVVDRYTDTVVGSMSRSGRGELWISDVELHPRVEWVEPAPDDVTVADLHDRSHHKCFIANSVRSEIRVIPS